jgi:4-hydroxybenzoyl-CoA reductase subunit alpha
LCRRINAVNDILPAHNIGSYVPMVDGPEKVSGRAKYTADFIIPGMLAGRIFRSPYSHAEILEVDVAEAVKLPGVKAIVTGAECDKPFGVLPVAPNTCWRVIVCAIAASRLRRLRPSTTRRRRKRCAKSS